MVSERSIYRMRTSLENPNLENLVLANSEIYLFRVLPVGFNRSTSQPSRQETHPSLPMFVAHFPVLATTNVAQMFVDTYLCSWNGVVDVGGSWYWFVIDPSSSVQSFAGVISDSNEDASNSHASIATGYHFFRRTSCDQIPLRCRHLNLRLGCSWRMVENLCTGQNPPDRSVPDQTDLGAI